MQRQHDYRQTNGTMAIMLILFFLFGIAISTLTRMF